MKIYNNSLNSTHIHLLVKAKTQKNLHDFLRVLTGQIAQRITGAVRGKKNKLGFWLRSAWKRIIHWGRDFLNLHQYIYRNQLESLALIPYQPRKRKPPGARSQPLKPRLPSPIAFGSAKAQFEKGFPNGSHL